MPSNLDNISPSAWVYNNQFVNETQNPLEFKQHKFLIKPFSDLHPDQVVKKSAQVGFSCTAILKSIWLARYFGLNIIYALPTNDILKGFVQPKVDMLIASNPKISKMVTTDSLSTKKIGERFIHFKGTGSQREAISTSADLLVVDEYDRALDMTVVQTFDSRLQYSPYAWRWRFSNPSGIGFGVDRLYQESDQMHWFVKCTCGHEWYLDWAKEENNHYIDQEREIYACGKCGKEITYQQRRDGRWVAKYPKNTKRRGYWISQLMAPWVSASHIIDQYNESSTEFFYNFVLGKAYTPADVLVTRETILRANAPGRPTLRDVVIGVDNGILKHYVIGSPNGIFRYGKTESWEEIESLFLTYDAIMVIDANPYPTMPKKLAEKYPGKVFMHYYSQDKKNQGITRWGEGENRGAVNSDRTKLLDMVAQELNEAKTIFTQSPMDLEGYIYHWTNIYRTVVENAQGISQGKWITLEGKPDHWAHATAYMRVALAKRLSGGMGRILRPSEPQIGKAYVDHLDIAKSVKAAKREQEIERE